MLKGIGILLVFMLAHSLEANDNLTIAGNAYEVAFSAENGSFQYFLNKETGEKTEFGISENGLWSLTFVDGKNIAASQFSRSSLNYRFSHQTIETTTTFIYESNEVTVKIGILAYNDYLDFIVKFLPATQSVSTFIFPEKLVFESEKIHRFYLPYTVGIAFKSQYFTLDHKKIYRYPEDLFSDFVQMDMKGGSSLSIYVVQPDTEDCIFVPAQLEVGSRQGKGFTRHLFQLFAPPEKEFTCPKMRLRFQQDVQTALIHYGEENGFTRRLEEKVPASLFPKLCECLIFTYYGERYSEKTKNLKILPSPTLIFFCDYLLKGFDSNYPDHLPPDPRKSTPEEFREFFDHAHSLGHLLMPYTNPTLWIINIPGPTLEQYGIAALVRNLQGRLEIENYSDEENPKYGVPACPWHPVTKMCYRRIRQQFTKEYPADVLFQDQVGAHPCYYDTNSASPTPYAYTQGLANMAKEDAGEIVLSTENGFDRLINSVTMFCTNPVSVPRVDEEDMETVILKHGTLNDKYGEDGWEFSPLALWLAHDKVIFSLKPINNIAEGKILTWALGLGLQLNYALMPWEITNRPDRVEWMKWLLYLEQKIAAHYLGKKLTTFTFIAPGVMSSCFEDTHIIANTTSQPYSLSPAITIAPYGFYAKRDKVEAGILQSFDGKSYDKNSLYFVREELPQTVSIGIYAPSCLSVQFLVSDIKQIEVKANQEILPVDLQENIVRFRTISHIPQPSFVVYQIKK